MRGCRYMHPWCGACNASEPIKAAGAVRRENVALYQQDAHGAWAWGSPALPLNPCCSRPSRSAACLAGAGGDGGALQARVGGRPQRTQHAAAPQQVPGQHTPRPDVQHTCAHSYMFTFTGHPQIPHASGAAWFQFGPYCHEGAGEGAGCLAATATAVRPARSLPAGCFLCDSRRACAGR